MSNISAKDVVALRQKTGLGMMDCKKALVATNGDFDEAVDYLRKKGISKGESRAGRATGEGRIESYIHPGSRIGVMVEVLCETDFVARSDVFIDLTHDIALHIAAAAPLVVRRDQISSEVIEHEMEIYREQMKEEGKPKEIIDRIADGKLEKYYQESCLLEQPFVKDPKVKIGDLVLQVAGKLKENIKVNRFDRLVLGE